MGYRTRNPKRFSEVHGPNVFSVFLYLICVERLDRLLQCCELASPPTATPYGRWAGSWSRTPDIRSTWTPWAPDIRSPWTPWGSDTRRANGDIEIEVDVGIDDIRDPNRQPRIDVHGRRWRKFTYIRSEVPEHARRARWWWLSAADRW